MPLAVVPPFSVQTSPATQIIPAGANPSAELNVVVRGNSDHASAVVHPKVPSGWKTRAGIGRGEFARSGEHASEFKVLPDGAKEGRYQVQAVAASQRTRIQRRLQPGGPSRHRRILLLPARLAARSRRRCESPVRTEGRLHHGRGRRHSQRCCASWGST